MSTPVLIDISMLAHRLIPDEIPLAGDGEREFVPVFPEALTKMLAGADAETAQLFDETLRAYKRATHAKDQDSKKRGKRNGRLGVEDASAGVGDFIHLWSRLREAGKSAVYGFPESANGSESSVEESQWIRQQIEDGHLRYHLRSAYSSRLGIKPDPLLDQYYFEVLAGLTVGRIQSPRTRLLLASVGTVTLEILAQATGVLLLDPEKNLSSAKGRMVDTIQGYIERKRRFFAEIQPYQVLEQLIEAWS